MRNQSVAEWLEENYPTYVGNVTVDPAGKETERRIVKDHSELKVEVPHYSYKRYGYGLCNVVAQKFASAISALNLGFSARLTNCGMAAISTVLSAMGKRNMFIGQVLYPETECFFADFFADSTVRHGKGSDLPTYSDASLFLEPVGNGLGMPVFDLESVFRNVWENEIAVILDNTLLTCSLLNPFEVYAKIQKEKGDPKMQLIYVESLSKHYRAGVNDVVTAGIIVGPDNFISKVDNVIMRNGTYLQFPCLRELPFDLFSACCKIMPQLCENAKAAADFLRKHPKVKEVSYPDLPNGAGGVLYFVVDDRNTKEVISGMEATFNAYMGSFGHAHTTWIPFGKFLQDVPKGLIRLAVGFETKPQDLISALRSVLG